MTTIMQAVYAWWTGHQGITPLLIGGGVVILFVLGAVVVARIQRQNLKLPPSGPLKPSEAKVKDDSTPDPPATTTEWNLFYRAQGDFSSLTWAQQTCLCLVYQQGPLHWGELGKRLEALGFAEVHEKLVKPVNATTLVSVDLHNIRVGPSMQPVVIRYVEHWIGKLRRL